MGLYGRFVLPHLVQFACGLKPARRQRLKIVPKAAGKVLEIGFGSGLNLPFYRPDAVEKIWALEPADAMWKLATEQLAASSIAVERIAASAEEISLADASVDTVVVTYALCVVPDIALGLAEIKRVLKPGGSLLFCEHGAAPDPEVLRWQNRLNPVWRPLAGGCNLNRHVPSLLESAGFEIAELDTMYIPGWRPATFNYWGRAIPRPE